MAYRLRVYAPTGQGVGSIWVRDAYENTLSYTEPAGTGTPCADLDITDDIIITFGVIDNTTIIDNWKINYDNVIDYQNTDECTITYSSAYSNVYVLLSVKQSGQPEQPERPGLTTYYASLSFNANGGSGAPSTLQGNSTDGAGYVKFTIPTTTPTRSGYTFSGWAENASGSGTIRYPGDTYTGYGTTTPPYPKHVLYAVWTESSSEGVWVFYDGAWKKATPYVFHGGTWKKATLYVFHGGTWKKSII